MSLVTSFLIRIESKYFGHYYVHHQEFAAMMLTYLIGRYVMYRWMNER